MDRRQRKTRDAIFAAFIELLSQKEFDSITVGDIITLADIGRATFYAHFETKDFLLKELCEDLFCHILDAVSEENAHHRHLFACTPPDSVFLHLIQHLQKNDNTILRLLASQNNALFLRYFKHDLQELVTDQLALFESEKSKTLPQDYWVNHITSTFLETIKWWIENGMKESPETITDYFFSAVR